MFQGSGVLKTRNILFNVSEFEGIDEATESLVSMSQAYKDLDKMDIINVLNNIGNNYSIKWSNNRLRTNIIYRFFICFYGRSIC